MSCPCPNCTLGYRPQVCIVHDLYFCHRNSVSNCCAGQRIEGPCRIFPCDPLPLLRAQKSRRFLARRFGDFQRNQVGSYYVDSVFLPVERYNHGHAPFLSIVTACARSHTASKIRSPLLLPHFLRLSPFEIMQDKYFLGPPAALHISCSPLR